MKKNLLLVLVFIALGINSYAQTYVSTTPENKKVIVEEFTGVKCPNCPAGHVVLADILSANPGVVFGIGYHPTNSSYTTPYAGDPDFRRAFTDAFYSTPYCGTSRFMPSAFTNRREYGGERIQSRSDWAGHTTTLLTESSPVNVGFMSNYNTTTNQLDVTVEVYYTATVTEPNTLYVMLAENNLVSQQSGASGQYTHKHVFRENLTTAQWGDPLTTTTQGHLETINFSFDNTTTGYDMTNCELVAFVRNGSNEEILSGNGAHVGSTTVSVDNKEMNNASVGIYPNPVTKDSKVNVIIKNDQKVSIQIMNTLGMLVYNQDYGVLNSGSHSLPLNTYGLSKGIYLVTFNLGNSLKSEKIIIE